MVDQLKNFFTDEEINNIINKKKEEIQQQTNIENEKTNLSYFEEQIKNLHVKTTEEIIIEKASNIDVNLSTVLKIKETIKLLENLFCNNTKLYEEIFFDNVINILMININGTIIKKKYKDGGYYADNYDISFSYEFFCEKKSYLLKLYIDVLSNELKRKTIYGGCEMGYCFDKNKYLINIIY